MRRILTFLLLCHFVTCASAALFDDFEGYDIGPMGEMTGDVWQGGSASIVMPALGNKVLDVTGNNDPARRALGALEIPATDTETTVFFRARVIEANPDTLIGVTDNAAPDSFGHMQAYIQFTSDFIKARNGGSIVDLLGFTVGQWYNIWIVVNNNANTYDVYVNQGTANATATDRYADNFGFRYTSNNPLITFANVYGTGAVLDDIYITPGLDLTNPPLRATVPEADDMTRSVWDAELPVENGDFTLPGTNSTGMTDVPGWTDNNAPYSADTGTRATDSSDGDTWHFSQDLRTAGDNGPIWQITSTPMVEGVTYTFVADIQGRWDCNRVQLAIVTGPYTGTDPEAPAGSGNPAVAFATAEYTIGNNTWSHDLSVSYTATAADAGKLVGIRIKGDSTVDIENSWMRIDNVRLYTGYLVVRGPQDPTPANEAAQVEPGTVTLSWTPSNDPNTIGQNLVYYVDNYLNFADIASYNSSAVSVPLGTAIDSQSISADYDQYVLWRIDTVTDANTMTVFTGETWYFVNDFTDEQPVITPGSNWVTWLGQPAVTLTATVEDFDEGDIDAADNVWSIVGDATPWQAAMQMYDRSGDTNLAILEAAGYDPNLYEDWIGTDARTNLATLEPLILTLSGVPAGTYTWTSFHHDPVDQTGLFDVTVIDAAGSATITGIDVTNGAQEPNQPFTATIVSDGGDIQLLFDNQSGQDNSNSFFVMNGFVLHDTVNAVADLAVDFGTPTNATAVGYQAYTASHEVATTFTAQTFSAFGGTDNVTVTPTWASMYAELTDVSGDPLAPAATFASNFLTDFTIQLDSTDRGGSLGDQAAEPVQLTVRIAEDACAAALLNGASYNAFDSDQDCDVDLLDFAAFAAQWLDDLKPTGAIAY